jgi:hypothetical protein
VDLRILDGRVRKSLAIPATPKVLVSAVPAFALEIDETVSRKHLPISSDPNDMVVKDPPAQLKVAFVDCPYCDGENIVGKAKSSNTQSGLPDREIACKHCQCLFLLSESVKGIRSRLVGRSDAA